MIGLIEKGRCSARTGEEGDDASSVGWKGGDGFLQAPGGIDESCFGGGNVHFGEEAGESYA